jgi:glycosyltransferase involved in cell wall biosynthesis
MSKRRLYITVDARMINHSGIGTYIKSLIPALTEDHNVFLLGDEDHLKKFPWSLKVNIIKFLSPIYSVNEQVKYPGIVPETDLLISPHYNIPILPVKAKKRLVIIHDVNHLVFYDQLSLRQKIYAKNMYNRAVSVSDSVITISEFSRSEIVTYTKIKDQQLHVLYFGFHNEKQNGEIPTENVDIIKNMYGLPESYLLYVGSIKPHKNFRIMLEVLKKLIKDEPDKKLVVVGIRKNEVNQSSEIRNILHKNEKLQDALVLTDYVDGKHLQLIYKNASCLIFPSLYEGFGLPPLEAMKNGCPAAVSQSASIPEVCNSAALYFNPNDPNDILNCVKKILNDDNLKADLIRKGYENLNRFTFDKFKSKLSDIINQIIEPDEVQKIV